MEISTPNTMPGDLPVQSTEPEQRDTSPKSVQIQEAPGSSAKPDPKPAIDKAAMDKERAILNDLGSNMDLSSVAGKNKKKRNKKPKSKRGMGAPTGFEDFYADAPVTPQEYEELRKIYAPTRPFIDRMDEALMRYQASRRLETLRMNIFSKYLQYGGVCVGPNWGCGVSKKELKDMNPNEAMKARNMAAIREEVSRLEVNFDEVVRGYLSSFFPFYFNPEDQDMIKLGTVTIRNFLSYLLYHDVCPEYKKNIEQAREICDRATVELWKNQQLVQQGPGNFNKACSMLFGGYYFEYAEIDGMTRDIARKVVKLAIAGAGSNEQASRFKSLVDHDALSVKRVLDIDGFVITAVLELDPLTRGFYQEYAPDLVPVGKIQAKAFRDPAKLTLDLSAEECLEWDHRMETTPTFEFFIEESLLAHCYLGMKITTAVWEVNCGLHFFDEIMSAYASFYTVICNDLMLEFKRPRDLTGAEAEEYHDVVETVGIEKQ